MLRIFHNGETDKDGFDYDVVHIQRGNGTWYTVSRPMATSREDWNLYLHNQFQVLVGPVPEPARVGSQADMKAWDQEMSRTMQEMNWKLSEGTPFDAKVAMALKEHTTNLDFTDWDLVERDIEKAILTSSAESLRASVGQMDLPPYLEAEKPVESPQDASQVRAVASLALMVVGLTTVIVGGIILGYTGAIVMGSMLLTLPVFFRAIDAE